MTPVTDSVLQLDVFSRATMGHTPYAHAVVSGLFRPDHARALAETFPTDHYRIVSGGAEKRYRYDARPLVAFGRDEISFAESLSPEWRSLGRDLASSEYRETLGKVIGVDLRGALLEVNLFHYGPRCLLEPHTDLADKIVTHVLYFNDAWSPADGGCLRILRSADPDDVAIEIPPLVGTSAILVRSENSWHGVPPVKRGVAHSRRTLTATFYRRGSASTLFPEDEDYRLVTLGPNGSGPVDRLQELVFRAVKRIGRR